MGWSLVRKTGSCGALTDFLSGILAVEQVAHGFAASGICALIGLQGICRFCAGRIVFAARRTMVGKARLSRLEFEFLSADDAFLDGEIHFLIIFRGRTAGMHEARQAGPEPSSNGVALTTECD